MFRWTLHHLLIMMVNIDMIVLCMEAYQKAFYNYPKPIGDLFKGTMNIFFYLFVWFERPTYLYALQTFTHWKQTDEERKLDEFPNKELKNNADIMYRKYNATDNDVCIRLFHSMPRCQAFNVIQQKNATLTCIFFSSSNGTVEQNSNSIFFQIGEQQCSGYCEELSYLKLCSNKCTCNSLCHSLIPHFCDCTTLKKTLKSCDNTDIRVFGYPLAGQYYIDDGDKTFIGFCQIDDREPTGNLSLTVYRQLKRKMEGKNRYIYNKGFGKPYSENYFIGYKRLAQVTKNKNMRLTLMYMNETFDKFYLEYDNFELKRYTEYYRNGDPKYLYRSSYSKIHNLQCLPNVLEIANSRRYKCPRYDLFGSCEKDYITIEERKFVSATFLLRPQNKMYEVNSDGKVLRNRHMLKKNNDIKESLCISFEFKVGKKYDYYYAPSLEYHDKTDEAWYLRFHLDIHEADEFVFWDYFSDSLKAKAEYSINTFNSVQLSMNNVDGMWYKRIYLNGSLIGEYSFVDKRKAFDVKCRIEFLFGSSLPPFTIRNVYLNGELMV